MNRPGNWNRDPWNRGRAQKPRQSAGLSPIMRAIVEARVQQQCTQAWLAEKVGCGVTSVQQYEAGTRKAPLAYAEAAAQALGGRVAYLRRSGE